MVGNGPGAAGFAREFSTWVYSTTDGAEVLEEVPPVVLTLLALNPAERPNAATASRGAGA